MCASRQLRRNSHYLASGANAVENEYLKIFEESKTSRMWNLKPSNARRDARKQPGPFRAKKAMQPRQRLCCRPSGQAAALVTIESLAATSRVTFVAIESVRTGTPVRV